MGERALHSVSFNASGDTRSSGVPSDGAIKVIVMSTCIVFRSIELGAASLPRRVIHFLHNLVSLLMYIGAGSLHQEGMVELGGRSPG